MLFLDHEKDLHFGIVLNHWFSVTLFWRFCGQRCFKIHIPIEKKNLFSYGIENSKNLRFESLIIVDPKNYMHCIRISILAELILDVK